MDRLFFEICTLNYCHALHAKDADNLPRLWAIKTRYYYFLGSHGTVKYVLVRIRDN